MKPPVLPLLGFAQLTRYGFYIFIYLGFSNLSFAQNCQLSIANGQHFECDNLPPQSSTASKTATNNPIQTNSSNKHVTVAVATSLLPLNTQSNFNQTTASKLVQSNNQTTEKLLSPASLWEMRLQDITLAQTLQRWSQQAGWKLIWDVDKHILIDSPHQFKGSFEEAVGLLLAAPSFAAAGLPLEVCFYPNTPPLARITRKGEQDKECI